MNREFLFRGQTRRYGEKIINVAGDKMPSKWVYGGVFQGCSDHSIIYGYDPVEKHAVYSDTVGQYTGITDKNGNKIFEGDIVKGVAYSNERIGVIVWIDEIASFGIRYRKRNDPTAWENSSILKQIQAGRKDQFAAEIIGNIYDNPELLEVHNG